MTKKKMLSSVGPRSAWRWPSICQPRANLTGQVESQNHVLIGLFDRSGKLDLLWCGIDLIIFIKIKKFAKFDWRGRKGRLSLQSRRSLLKLEVSLLIYHFVHSSLSFFFITHLLILQIIPFLSSTLKLGWKKIR